MKTPERRLVPLMLIWNRFHTLFRDLRGWVSTRNAGWEDFAGLGKFSKKEFNHLNQMITPEMKPNKDSDKETFSKGKSVIQKRKKEIYLRWGITLWYAHCSYHTKTISVVKRGPVLFFQFIFSADFLQNFQFFCNLVFPIIILLITLFTM